MNVAFEIVYLKNLKDTLEIVLFLINSTQVNSMPSQNALTWAAVCSVSK